MARIFAEADRLGALRRPNVSGAGSEAEMMNDARDDAKLAKLIQIEGYDSIEAVMEAVFSDSVSLPSV